MPSLVAFEAVERPAVGAVQAFVDIVVGASVADYKVRHFGYLAGFHKACNCHAAFAEAAVRLVAFGPKPAYMDLRSAEASSFH